MYIYRVRDKYYICIYIRCVINIDKMFVFVCVCVCVCVCMCMCMYLEYVCVYHILEGAFVGQNVRSDEQVKNT